MRKLSMLTISCVGLLSVPTQAHAAEGDSDSQLEQRVKELESEIAKLKKGLGAIGDRTRAGVGDQESHGPKFGTMEFGGFLNAPMRFGLGERKDPKKGQKKRTIHSPIIPDDQFNAWQHTEHNPRNWAEMNFRYGNELAKANLAFQAYNFSEAAWNEQNAQMGIGRAYVSLTPRLKGTQIRLRAKVGAFSEAYGAASKHSNDHIQIAGQHGTFLFGRVRTIGEVIKLQIPIKAFQLNIDHGVGANRPDPSVWNTSRFSMLHHAHAVLKYRRLIEIGAHYLTSWAQEELRPTNPNEADQPKDKEWSEDFPDGRMSVYGGDIRLNTGRFGYYYGGYSYVRAQAVGLVGAGIEVAHATGGGRYSVGIKGNYLDGPAEESNGNGAVHTMMLETEHSLRTFLEGDEFWGQGRDLSLRTYAMLNKIESDDEYTHGQWRFKWGTDVLFNALPWLQAAVRYDRVQPDNKRPEQSFAILSPRLIFRTNWITNEFITLQYSRYFYNQRTCPGDEKPGGLGAGQYCVQPPSGPIQPDGFGADSNNLPVDNRATSTHIPDENVLTIQATMWW